MDARGSDLLPDTTENRTIPIAQVRAGERRTAGQGAMHCRDRGKCAITGRAFSAAPWPPKPGVPPSRQLCPCSPLTFLHLMLTHRQLPLAGSDPYCQKTFSATAPIMSVPELTAGKQKGKGYTKTRVLGVEIPGARTSTEKRLLGSLPEAGGGF